MAPAASKSRPPAEIEDDGPVLRPDLSDLFNRKGTEPPAKEEEVDKLFAPADEVPQEGTPSGLIDIRSLASAYFTGQEAADDSEPLRSRPAEPAFEPPKVVVVSRQEAPQRGRASRIVLMSAVGLLTVIATALATIVLVRSGTASPAAEPSSAANPGSEPPGGTGPIAPERKAPAPALVDPDEGDHAEAVAESGEEGEEEVIEFAADEVEPEAPERRAPEAGVDSRKRAAQTTEADEDEIVLAPAMPADSSAEKPAAQGGAEDPTSSETPAPKRETAEGEPAEEYDDVDCLLNPGKPECQTKASAGADKDDEAEDLPAHLTRAQIEAGLAPMRGRLSACGARHDVTGVAELVLEVRGDGKVKSGRTRTGNAEFQSCVSSLLSKARFARTQSGQTVRYPLILR